MTNLAKTINKMINNRKKMISNEHNGHSNHASTINFSNEKHCKKVSLR